MKSNLAVETKTVFDTRVKTFNFAVKLDILTWDSDEICSVSTEWLVEEVQLLIVLPRLQPRSGMFVT